jgi:hypothetical protein
MKHLSLILAALAAAAPARAASTVALKDGSIISASTITPQGTKFHLVPEGGGQARVVDGSTIDRIEMPEPASLTETYAAFAAADTVRTLTAMGRLNNELDPFKKIPGARDWWLEAEFLRAHILLSQRRAKEIEATMGEIAGDAADPEAQRHAQVFLAHLTGLAGDPRKALAQLKEIILASRDPETLADAWLFAGQHHAAVNEQQQALLAFLRIPVFYPGRTVPLAGARLGAARAFVALEDFATARTLLKELVSTQGTTLEGAEGAKLLTQVEKELGLAPDSTDPPDKPAQPEQSSQPTQTDQSKGTN